MKNYNQLVATNGVYTHMAMGGAGSTGSQSVLTSTSDTFDPGDNSFVYAIIPGSDGVKFYAMEEDGVRVVAAREGYTYKAHQAVTGRFTRLHLETGDCVLLIAEVGDYYFPQPYIRNLFADSFEAQRQSSLTAYILANDDYTLFKGKDFGLILEIGATGITVNDITVGTVVAKKGIEDVATLTAYHVGVAADVATYYIAASDTDIDAGLFLAALQDEDVNNILIPLTLDIEGEHTIVLKLSEFIVTAPEAELEPIGRVLETLKATIETTPFIPSTEADILTFTVPDQIGDTVIGDGTIDIVVPNATVVTALVATFTTSADITSIKVGEVTQITEVTANDFTAAVTYVVIAEDTETTKEWVVTITIAEAE